MDIASLVPQVEELARALNKDTFTVSDLWKSMGPKPADALWYVITYTMAQSPDHFTRLSSNKWQLKGAEVKAPAPKSAKATPVASAEAPSMVTPEQEAAHEQPAATFRTSRPGHNGHDSRKRLPKKSARPRLPAKVS